MPLYYEWVAYNRINPFTLWRTDYQTSMIIAHLSNVIMARSGSRQKFTPDKFMPQFYETPKMSAKQIYNQLKSWVINSVPVDNQRKNGR